MCVTQKEAHKTRVSRSEATGCLVRAVHPFFMQTDILVNGRSYVKKISEPVLLLLFPSNIPSKGEGRTALPSLSVRLTPSRLIPRPFVRRLCPAKPPFPPSPSSPLSCPLHSGSSMASCKSHLLGHASLPNSKARVCFVLLYDI